MKKTLSIFVAIFMILALSIPAFAAPGDAKYDITISNPIEGHHYEAYQILDGDYIVDGDQAGQIQSVIWGANVTNPAAFLAALKADATIGADFTAAATPANVATVMAGWATRDNAKSQAFAEFVAGQIGTNVGGDVLIADYDDAATPANYTIADADDGYYFIRETAINPQGDNDAITRYVLEVVKDVEITPKTGIPSVVKKVKEDTQFTADDGYGVGYNDVADYDIGDTVPFMFVGTMPSTLADYTTYAYSFWDTMSAGLTFVPDSVEVTIDGTAIDAALYTVEQDAADLPAATVTFGVVFGDIIADAVASGVTLGVGSKVVVTYDATLNDTAVIGLDGNPNEVYLQYSNNPNAAGAGDTGTTPEDKVIVFTYELDVTKVDGTDNTITLPGAKFKLFKTDTGLVGGARTYVTLDAVTTDPDVANDYKVTGWAADGTEIETTATGFFSFIGLDDGTYFLEETQAPVGYNALTAPVELVIDATTVNNQTWNGAANTALTAITLSVDGDAPAAGDINTGIVATEIENNSGATLPSTGGIGTTIFYVVGIAMMLGAAILFITKKRMVIGAAA